MQVNTPYGPLQIRDDYDREVVREVIDEDQYRRWGDIEIRSGTTVLDLGAHLGSFSLLALKHGARVVAVEPNEGNYQLLERNTQGLPITRLNVAVADGQPVHLLVDAGRNELHKLVETAQANTVKVPSVTLDSLIDQYGPIDLLKMDIEGAEYPVLFTAKRLEAVRQITLEWHYGSTNLAKLILSLEARGFKTVWLGGNGEWGHLQLKQHHDST
jgi:FkbM family methyltransferase